MERKAIENKRIDSKNKKIKVEELVFLFICRFPILPSKPIFFLLNIFVFPLILCHFYVKGHKE